jgi:hypothetical protein
VRRGKTEIEPMVDVMPQSPEQDEPIEEDVPLQLEYAGSGGSGRSVKTALGLFDSNHSFDPQLLTEEAPYWFHYVRRRVHKHFYQCFAKMPKERAFRIMEACGFPPLCILTIAVRWSLLGRSDNFDHFDLQAVFETAGYDVSNFGKTLNQIEMRCLYRLDKTIGTKSEQMLANAGVDEFTYLK